MGESDTVKDFEAQFGELSHLEDGVVLVTSIFDWLRPDDPSRIDEVEARVRQMEDALAADPDAAESIRTRVRTLLVKLRFLPLYSSTGILPRRHFAGELWHRIYNQLLPKPPLVFSAKTLLKAVFHEPTDHLWVSALPDETWLRIYEMLLAAPAECDVEDHLFDEVLYALEMLSIWLAAEEMEEDLLRLDPAIAEYDSSFIAQEREISSVVTAFRSQRSRSEEPEPVDAAHARVMLQQCADQFKRFRQLALRSGSDLNLTYLLERLEQTMARIRTLLDIATAEQADRVKLSLDLFRRLVAAQHAESSVRGLVRQTSYLLAKSVTSHASRTGEHYVTESRRDYVGMLRRGLGGGVLIAVMAWIKIWIGAQGLSEGSRTLWVSLNYGLGFVVIHMLHLTVATKQPAMTASYIAEQLEHARNGRADKTDLAQLLIRVWRSQFAAIVGNVAAALPVAVLLAFALEAITGQAVMTTDKANALMQEQNALTSPALFYAGIAGIWLFVSGLVAGYYDNLALRRDLPARIRHNPLLVRATSASVRDRLAAYVRDHYGAIVGNFFFGVMLGVTAYVGYLLGLPLDIRHVAFSVANVGMSATVLTPQLWIFLEFVVFALLIGVVNLLVSFFLALNVAMRARRIRFGSLREIGGAFWGEVRRRPGLLFFPPLPVMDEAEPSGGP